MRVLVITDIWIGLQDVLFKGTNAQGMPAFINPIKEFISQGNDVDFFLIHNYNVFPEYNIKVDWLDEKQIVGNILWSSKSLLKKPLCIYKLQRDIKNLIKHNKYDLIYVHGVHGSLIAKLAQKHNIPFGQRLYGTFFNDYLNKYGVLKSKIRYYTEYKAFTLKKDFLLVTNDGSCGDKVYNKLNKNRKPFDFYFWFNGVDRAEDIPAEQIERCKADLMIEDKPFLFYVARITPWKRQDKAIDILNILKQNGYDFNLYIAGQIQDENYYEKLIKKVDELNLSKSVKFLGPISKPYVNAMCKDATACFSLYDVCNLGNVFHEMMALGAVVVATDDGTVSQFLSDRKNGFLINDLNNAAQDIIDIFNDKEFENKIRVNAKRTSEERVKSWDDRINDEIVLLKKYAQK